MTRLRQRSAHGGPTSHRTETANLDRIILAETERFRRQMPQSAHMTEVARSSLAGGVTSSWQISDPHPIWIESGRGSRVTDVDGNEYVDFHGGYGAMLAGHAHPAIVKAVSDRLAQGTHFAQPVAGRDGGGARSCRRVIGSRSGGSATAAPRQRWMRSISCVPSPAET